MLELSFLLSLSAFSLLPPTLAVPQRAGGFGGFRGGGGGGFGGYRGGGFGGYRGGGFGNVGGYVGGSIPLGSVITYPGAGGIPTTYQPNQYGGSFPPNPYVSPGYALSDADDDDAIPFRGGQLPVPALNRPYPVNNLDDEDTPISQARPPAVPGVYTPYATSNSDEDLEDAADDAENQTQPRPAQVATSIPVQQAAPILPTVRNSIIVYDKDFNQVIGTRPTIEMAARRGQPVAASATQNSIAGVGERHFAYDGGIWVPDRNEVWFTSDISNKRSTIRILNLATNAVTYPQLSRRITNPSSGYFFNGRVYLGSYGTATAPHGVFAIDPRNGNVTPLVNKYQNVTLSGPTDVTFISDYGKNNKTSMFFTDTVYGSALGISDDPKLPNSVYRVDFGTRKIHQIIPSTSLNSPHGVAVDPSQTRLFVTNAPADGTQGDIRMYDLNENWDPVSPLVFATVAKGVPNGICIDDYGRVWTAEPDGIMVRNGAGKVIGQFNAKALSQGGTAQSPSIVNFALAGDTLVVLGLDVIYKIKLAQQVVTRGRYYTEGLYRLEHGPNSIP